MNRPTASAPADILRTAIREGMDPLPSLAAFRFAQQRFHDRMAARSPVTCARGCGACCSQMVFDVHPVEVEDLGRHLRRTGRDAKVLGRLRARRDHFDQVRREVQRLDGESHDDWMERVALEFWSRAEPCVFLDPDGACSVHEHRPQSCRRHFVRGPAALCAPATAADAEREAFTMEPGAPDEVDELVERLGRSIPFDPEDDRLDHALVRWLENRSAN